MSIEDGIQALARHSLGQQRRLFIVASTSLFLRQAGLGVAIHG